MKEKKRKSTHPKKKIVYNVLAAFLFLAGLLVLFYPALSNYVNQFQQNKVVHGYLETVDGQTKEAMEEMKAQARRYNEDLLKDEIIVDPFDQVKDKKAGIRYYETLDPQHNGVMASIRIPSIDVELPIYHGTKEDVLQKAIGHLEQTSLPIGGKGTHAVISGHRGLPSAKLFTDLNLMKEGDVFYIDVLDETLAYEVDRVSTVEPHELEELAIVSGEDHVTLVTCTPYAINSHRLLVRGTRIPYQKAEEMGREDGFAKEIYDIGPYIVAFLILLVLFLVFILWITRRKKTRRRRKR